MKRFKSLWDRLLFRDKGIIPTKKTIQYYFLFLLGMILISFWHFSWTFIIVATVLAVCLTCLDIFLLPKKEYLTIEREILAELERYQEEIIYLHITNHLPDNYTVTIKDDLPLAFQSALPVEGKIKGKQKTVIAYSIQPLKRGKFNVEKIYTRFQSKLGLWARQITFSEVQQVKVIPNLTETKRYLESAQNYLLHEGIKIRKMRSGTGEFSKVRSYVIGDDPRKINWRQSAKLQDLMTNEYEPEHGKHITILIDCGRIMGVELKEANRLERSVEAAITLATAALQNGDHVSIICFSKEIKAFVPPGQGLEHMDTILQTIYSIEVDAHESNYQYALQYAQSTQRKRSMMVLFSDVQTFINEDYHLFYMKEIRKKHLFVMIGIEDHLLREKIGMYPASARAAMQKSIAQKQYLKQKQVMAKWEKHGLPMLEAPAERLAVTAISHYVDTLNRGLL